MFLSNSHDFSSKKPNERKKNKPKSLILVVWQIKYSKQITFLCGDCNSLNSMTWTQYKGTVYPLERCRKPQTKRFVYLNVTCFMVRALNHLDSDCCFQWAAAAISRLRAHSNVTPDSLSLTTARQLNLPRWHLLSVWLDEEMVSRSKETCWKWVTLHERGYNWW